MEKHFVEFLNQKSITKNVKWRANSVLSHLRKFHPKAKTVLELGVSIGDILKCFPKKYVLSGLDVDKQAISFAKKHIPHAHCFVASMHNFKFKKQDAIFSVFDSINYLKTFAQWKQTFRNVANHLNKDGLFIFDMYNTNIFKISNPRFLFLEEASGYYIDKITSEGNKLHYNSLIFDKTGKNTFKKNTTSWTETIFSEPKVEAELTKHFKILKKCDGETLKKCTKKTTRVLYVCRLK